MKKAFAMIVVSALVLSLAALAMAGAADKAPSAFDKAQAPGVKATDIVSAKELTVAATTVFSVHANKYYYFENAANKAAFDKEPAKYVK